MEKSIVYILDKNYIKMALNSIAMLRHFNKYIKVLCLSTEPLDFPENLNVENVVVKNIRKDYFLLNKSYLGNLDYKSILYIDSDTFIFGDVEKIFEYEEDFCGCENKWSYKLGFNIFKPFNGGVLLFNNYSHKKIYKNFEHKIDNISGICYDLYNWINKINNDWVKEEFLTSYIVQEEKIPCRFFDNKYVKLIESFKDIDSIKDSIIFHSFTNNWNFIRNYINKNNIKLFKYKKLNQFSLDE